MTNLSSFKMKTLKSVYRWIPCLHFNSSPLTAADRTVSRLAGKKIGAVYGGDYKKEGKR